MRSRKIWFAVFLLCAGIALGCSSAPSNVVVAVTPVAITVALNNEQSFTATVTGSSNTSVTWDVTGPTGAAVAGGNTNIGTIDTSGNYIAPNVYPSGCTPTPTAPCTVTITAVSAADTSVTGTATVTLSSGITLSVSPATATIGTSETYPFTSTITGTSNTAVTWTVCYVIKSAEDCNPADANGQTSNGTINSTTGLYTAPQIAPTAAVQIQAQSVQDPSVVVSASVNVVTAANPTVTSVSPNTAPQGQTFVDVYVTGTNFLTTTSVLVNGTPLPAFNNGVQSVLLPNPTFSNSGSSVTITGETTTLRARIPDFMLTAAPVPPATTATLTITVERQSGTPQSCPTPSLCQIAVTPTRPAIAGPSPDSVLQGSAGSVNFNIDGGFFGTNANPVVTGKYNGSTRAMSVNSNLNPVDSGRQLSVTVGGGLNSGDLSAPGLYPVTVQNNAQPQQVATANLAVRPAYGPPASITSTISDTVAHLPGTTPSAVAIDTSTGLAVVVNTGSNDVTLIDLSSGTPVVVVPSLCTAVITPAPSPCPTSAPTGVAVDNIRHLALVTNSYSNITGTPAVYASVAVINLTTRTVINVIQLNYLNANNVETKPYSVGINPATGRAVVAFQATDRAVLLDLTKSPPAIAGVVSASTGQSPEVAVDPVLDWAIITPGGLGSMTIADLSRQSSESIAAASASTPGAVRSGNTVTITAASTQYLQNGQPVLIQGIADNSFNGIFDVSVLTATTFTYVQTGPNASSGGGTISYANPVATLTVNLSVQGVSINPETHSALLTDPGIAGDAASLFNGLNEIVTPITNIAETGDVASAYNQLTDTGLILNNKLNQALVIDPTQPTAIEELTADLNDPVAVACDPITNQFVIVNQGNNSATVYSLGAVRALQITEVSPQVYNLTSSLTSPAVATSQTLTIVGGGFTSSSVARLDGIPLPTNFLSGRSITMTVPATMLSAPRRFALDVLNPGPAVSNGEDFSVTQTVDLTNPGCVEPAPDGVAVDPQNNVAVASLSGCNSVAVVNLSNGTGSVVSVGQYPAGVAVLPNVHLAAVANSGSNNVSIVDTVALDVTNTESVGTTPLGVDADQNSGEVAVACNGQSSVYIFNAVSPASSVAETAGTNPYGVAIDPVAGEVVSTDVTGNDLYVSDVSEASGPSFALGAGQGMAYPTGVVYDPIGYQFLVASSSSNQVFVASTINQQVSAFSVGINPFSIAYNPYSSTLVTTNTESGTMTVVDLLARQVRSVITVNSGSHFAVAINPWTNVATVADAVDNTLVFIPLPR
ncbi:MAG: YncE family protein [Candidatus Acidiferrales bacterium]|jgi:DNA-binding beta-propeller fold protein YncE